MQTLKVEIQDNLLDKILWLLNSFKGVKVEQVDNNRDEFLEDIQNSENDIVNGNTSTIGDVDSYIETLKNETN